MEKPLPGRRAEAKSIYSMTIALEAGAAIKLRNFK
jgi:hypothetical protein